MPAERETERYQKATTNLLKIIFGEPEVEDEWNVAKNSQDDFTRRLYCPRIDIAVGPFNITRDVENGTNRINETHQMFHEFVEGLRRISETYLEEYNENPRCFLAIEIEKKGSRKHMIGDIINASSLGKIGIIIPWDDKSLKAFIRIKQYLDFIKTVKKTSHAPKNLLIIKKDDFKQFLEDYGANA